MIFSDNDRGGPRKRVPGFETPGISIWVPGNNALVQDAVSTASHAALEYHLLVAVGIEAGACGAVETPVCGAFCYISVDCAGYSADGSTGRSTLGDALADDNFLRIGLALGPVLREYLFVDTLFVNYWFGIGRTARQDYPRRCNDQSRTCAHLTFPMVGYAAQLCRSELNRA